MSSLFDELSDELFQILKGSGKTLTLYDIKGNHTYEPSQARRVFVEPDKMMISVTEAGDDSEVTMYLSHTQDINDISDLVTTLRRISTRYNVLFNLRKYAKVLSPKDFAYQVESIAEAAMYGSTKTSYQKIGSAKLIVRHTMPVREGLIGSRGRNILTMFVETKQGERFRFPVVHLSGGRAFARHIAEGGKPHDETALRIVELAEESNRLTKVSRYVHHARNHLDESAQAVRGTVRVRIKEIRSQLQSLARPRGYSKIVERGLTKPLVHLQESEDRISAEVERLAELLSINTNHALAETLLPVALLTLGESDMKKLDEMFYSGMVAPVSVLRTLAEALASEYGYEEGIDWSMVDRGTYRSIYFENQSAHADAHDLLENIMDIGYVAEDEGDKFEFYARNWYIGRNKAMGTGDVLTKDQEPAVSQLADGLRDILSGKPVARAAYPAGENPGFANEQSQYAYELGLFLEPSAGLNNDALFTYISNIVDKLQNGGKLTQTENLIKDRLVDMVDDTQVDESLLEADGDDITNYATNWVNKRHSEVDRSAGINHAKEEKDKEKAAAELADGLRAVLSGQQVAKAAYPAPEETPSFTSMESQFAYELGLFLEPSAGMNNDALSTYISTIIDKLQGGRKLTQSEKIVMDRLLDGLDDSLHHGVDVEESELDEATWDPEGPYADRDRAEQNAESVMDDVIERFEVGEFLGDYHPEYLEQPEDEFNTVSSADVISSLTHYLNGEMERNDVNGYDCKSDAKYLWDKGEIQKELANNGWVVEAPVEEARAGRTGEREIDAYVDTAEADDVEVTVQYDVEEDDASVGFTGGIILNSVVIKATGVDILDALNTDQQAKLVQAAEQEEIDHAAGYADYQRDMAQDRAFEEDTALATPTIEDGDYVATDYGLGRVIEVKGNELLVELSNGSFVEVLADDVTPTVGESREDAAMAAWFEDFSPEAVLERNPDEYDQSTNQEDMYIGDRVVHKVYGPGEIVDMDNKLAKVKFDRPHARLPEGNTVTVSPGTLYKRTGKIFKDNGKKKLRRTGDMPEVSMQPTMEELTEAGLDQFFDDRKMGAMWEELKAHADKVLRDPSAFGITDPSNLPYDDTDEAIYDFVREFTQVMQQKIADCIENLQHDLTESEDLMELSVDKMMNYFDRAAQSRFKLDKASAHGDEEADRKMKKRDDSLELAFKKIHKKQGLLDSEELEEAGETDLVLPGDAGDAFVADVSKQYEPVDELGGEPGKYTVYGKTFDTRMFDSDDAANAFMAQHEGEWGVIGVKDGMVHVARMDDEGIQEAIGMQRLLTLAGRKGK